MSPKSSDARVSECVIIPIENVVCFCRGRGAVSDSSESTPPFRFVRRSFPVFFLRLNAYYLLLRLCECCVRVCVVPWPNARCRVRAACSDFLC